jgi:hypothetical protein
MSAGQARPDRLALKPYWGKPAVRHCREGDGNAGIIRSPVRAIALPDLLRPARNLVANLVYAETGRNVVLSMVAGRVIYRDGRFANVDADQVRREVQAAADRLQQATAADERTRDLPIVDLTRRGLA